MILDVSLFQTHGSQWVQVVLRLLEVLEEVSSGLFIEYLGLLYIPLREVVSVFLHWCVFGVRLEFYINRSSDTQRLLSNQGHEVVIERLDLAKCESVNHGMDKLCVLVDNVLSMNAGFFQTLLHIVLKVIVRLMQLLIHILSHPDGLKFVLLSKFSVEKSPLLDHTDSLFVLGIPHHLSNEFPVPLLEEIGILINLVHHDFLDPKCSIKQRIAVRKSHLRVDIADQEFTRIVGKLVIGITEIHVDKIIHTNLFQLIG